MAEITLPEQHTHVLNKASLTGRIWPCCEYVVARHSAHSEGSTLSLSTFNTATWFWIGFLPLQCDLWKWLHYCDVSLKAVSYSQSCGKTHCRGFTTPAWRKKKEVCGEHYSRRMRLNPEKPDTPSNAISSPSALLHPGPTKHSVNLSMLWPLELRGGTSKR